MIGHFVMTAEKAQRLAAIRHQTETQKKTWFPVMAQINTFLKMGFRLEQLSLIRFTPSSGFQELQVIPK